MADLTYGRPHITGCQFNVVTYFLHIRQDEHMKQTLVEFEDVRNADLSCSMLHIVYSFLRIKNI